jgi:N-methylhydantoinase B/oxoprolinase/acetone carboxylase alpha subunit
MGALFDRYVRLSEGLVYEQDAYGRRPGCDPDLIAHGLEPITAIERRGMERLTDLDAELLTHKLTTIIEEARDVYMALSISEAVMVGDMNCAIFTASGDPAAVATGIYFHTMLNNAQLKYANAYYRPDPSVGLADGDIFFFNDELGGGVHTYDMFTAMPVFFGDELVAWVTCGGHQGDTGSPVPGGFNAKAKTRYEEGFHIPMMRIGRNFLLHQDVLDFLAGSVRNGFVFTSDLRSRVATMLLMHRRLVREIERRDVETVVGGMRLMLQRGEEAARARLLQINDGVFRHVLFNDDEIAGRLGLTRLPVTLIKEGDAMTVLVQGVSPQNNLGPQHSTWHLSRAATAVYLFSYFFRGLAPNAGLLQPIKYLIEGPSIANATDEIAHGMGTAIAALVTNGAHVCGSKMLFDSPFRESVQAPHSRNQNVYIVAGTNRMNYPNANITGTANASGQGGRFDGDGESAIGFFWGPFTDAGEIEDIDRRFPHFVLARKLEKNYHGYGKYRGGASYHEISTPYGHAGCFLSSWGAADKLSHNPGLMGGYMAPPNPRIIIEDTDVLERIGAGVDLELNNYEVIRDELLKGTYRLEASGQPTERLKEGDLMMHGMGGGGGYGDVLERDPAAVARDVREQMTTPDIALRVYAVVLQPDGDVDVVATAERRAAVRRERLARGKPFDEFIAGWLAKRPPADIVEYYGHFPEPRVPGYDKPFWGQYA